VPQEPAAPFPAGIVAIQSQVATCSVTAPRLQKNVLAARHTTISKHALVRQRPQGFSHGLVFDLGDEPDDLGEVL
jgi:hypothetical protein